MLPTPRKKKSAHLLPFLSCAGHHPSLVRCAVGSARGRALGPCCMRRSRPWSVALHFRGAVSSSRAGSQRWCKLCSRKVCLLFVACLFVVCCLLLFVVGSVNFLFFFNMSLFASLSAAVVFLTAPFFFPPFTCLLVSPPSSSLFCIRSMMRHVGWRACFINSQRSLPAASSSSSSSSAYFTHSMSASSFSLGASLLQSLQDTEAFSRRESVLLLCLALQDPNILHCLVEDLDVSLCVVDVPPLPPPAFSSASVDTGSKDSRNADNVTTHAASSMAEATAKALPFTITATTTTTFDDIQNAVHQIAEDFDWEVKLLLVDCLCDLLGSPNLILQNLFLRLHGCELVKLLLDDYDRLVRER